MIMLAELSMFTIFIGGAMIMLAIDIVLYGLFAAWLDNVIPSGKIFLFILFH